MRAQLKVLKRLFQDHVFVNRWSNAGLTEAHIGSQALKTGEIAVKGKRISLKFWAKEKTKRWAGKLDSRDGA